MRTVFDKELVSLGKSVALMGEKVEDNYDCLFKAMKDNDESMIKNIIKNDRTVNDMQRSIEAQCLHLITMQQPLATDLRKVSASLKVVTDIERIGDHVTDMAEIILRLHMKDMSKVSAHIEEMIVQTRQQMHHGIESFIESKVNEEDEMEKEDDIIDGLFNKVKSDVALALKNENQDIDDCIDVLMIAKYLERIGDHSVNIGEWENFKEDGIINNIRLL